MHRVFPFFFGYVDIDLAASWWIRTPDRAARQWYVRTAQCHGIVCSIAWQVVAGRAPCFSYAPCPLGRQRQCGQLAVFFRSCDGHGSHMVHSVQAVAISRHAHATAPQTGCDASQCQLHLYECGWRESWRHGWAKWKWGWDAGLAEWWALALGEGTQTLREPLLHWHVALPCLLATSTRRPAGTRTQYSTRLANLAIAGGVMMRPAIRCCGWRRIGSRIRVCCRAARLFLPFLFLRRENLLQLS